MSLRGGTPHQIIAAALDDWWINTDPAEPFDADQVADVVERYLISSGYSIGPDTSIPPGPVPRRALATVALLGTATAAVTLIAALHSLWVWAASGALVTALLTREAVHDLTGRHHRSTR